MQFIKSIAIFCLLVFVVNIALAVGKVPDYIVYQNIGKCSKVVAGKEILLKKGDFLNASTVLNIPAGGKLMVLCANYQALQFETKGKYTLKNAAQQCKKGDGSFTAKYFRFVWDEFTHPHSSPEAKPEKYMKTAGAVTRGNGPVNFSANVDTVNYCDGLLSIKFKPESETVTMGFATTNKSQKFIFSQKSTGYISFDKFIATNQKPGTYYWQITTSNYKKSGFYVLNLMEKKQYAKNINAIVNNVMPIEDKAELAFMTGFLLEQKKYLIEAQQYYEEAIRLNPKDKTYEAFNARFITNNQLKL